jgi:aminoglycoside phosphotransferase (APT) family kinase protein
MTIVDNAAALHKACGAAGLDSSGAVVLGAHATAVFLLPRERVVARLGRGDQAHAQADRGVRMCRWLNDHGFPAPAPADVVQPIQVGDEVATFWAYYPQHSAATPAATALGELLRRLHDLPRPPIELPEYRPLTSLAEVVARSACLAAGDKAWLLDERDRLLDAYAALDSPLGVGHIHGDAYMGNLLADGPRTLLGDWDEVSVGPRELDLANTYHSLRFGQPRSQIRAFAAAYGHDISDWPGLATLCALRDVHTLTSFIRRADQGDTTALRELSFRLGTLRRRDAEAQWNSSVPLGVA